MPRRRRKAIQQQQLPTQLPARFESGFGWKLDRRCIAAREVAADLGQLWQDLGGPDRLSVQQLWLTERAVYLRRTLLEHESAVLNGRPGTMEQGQHVQTVNGLLGILKALGLGRKARDVPSLREYLAIAPERSSAGRSDMTPEDVS